MLSAARNRTEDERLLAPPARSTVTNGRQCGHFSVLVTGYDTSLSSHADSRARVVLPPVPSDENTWQCTDVGPQRGNGPAGWKCSENGGSAGREIPVDLGGVAEGTAEWGMLERLLDVQPKELSEDEFISRNERNGY